MNLLNYIFIPSNSLSASLSASSIFAESIAPIKVDASSPLRLDVIFLSPDSSSVFSFALL